MYYIYDVTKPDLPYEFNDGPAIFDTMEKASKLCEMMNCVIHDRNFTVREVPT